MNRGLRYALSRLRVGDGFDWFGFRASCYRHAKAVGIKVSVRRKGKFGWEVRRVQ
jgi:hypothetical protein